MTYDQSLATRVDGYFSARRVGFESKRPMRGFVFVTAEVLRTERQLESWLALALAFNPKAKASKRSAARKRS